MYTLVKADEGLTGKLARPVVFLGGQVKGRDWRHEFYMRFERMDVTFVSPKRDHFLDPEMDPSGHANQVAWEREALDAADIGVFWLGDGLSNQASRVEVGYLLGAKKPVLVGAEKGFMGIEHLVGFSGLVVASSVEGLMGRFGSMLSAYQAS